jgi:hypothetical protein
MSTGSASLADPTSLLGEWRLSRVIDDRLAGEQSLVSGMLSLTAVSPDRIRWAEQGHWHQPAGDVAVCRGLWLVRDEGSQGWWVRFEDERDFHPWLPGEAVVHPCAPDTYRGVVDGTPERWTVEWEVTGPAKDYSMSTELTREV